MASHQSASQVRRLIPGSLEWRCVGPFRGGRVVTVAGDVSNPMVFYFGCAGGVWKTNGGRSWERVLFRRENAGSNDIWMDPTNPRVIYATTAERA